MLLLLQITKLFQTGCYKAQHTSVRVSTEMSIHLKSVMVYYQPLPVQW
jgi:hypothetical protein